jgi:hypothetical protein
MRLSKKQKEVILSMNPKERRSYDNQKQHEWQLAKSLREKGLVKIWNHQMYLTPEGLGIKEGLMG